jgi:hypothetical protein
MEAGIIEPHQLHKCVDDVLRNRQAPALLTNWQGDLNARDPGKRAYGGYRLWARVGRGAMPAITAAPITAPPIAAAPITVGNQFIDRWCVAPCVGCAASLVLFALR